MDGIITDLLDFTRGRLGGGIPVVCVETDIEAICRQTIDEVTAFHPGCVVHFEATGDLSGEWDGGRIGQVLSNLVGNAYEHGSENAPVEVAVRASRGPMAGEHDGIVLTVHNKGPVIPKTDLKNIFNPFRRFEPARSRSADRSGSVGLGLYITQAIVTAHRGTIEVESTKSGTTFTILLPRRAAAATQATGRPSRHPS